MLSKMRCASERNDGQRQDKTPTPHSHTSSRLSALFSWHAIASGCTHVSSCPSADDSASSEVVVVVVVVMVLAVEDEERHNSGVDCGAIDGQPYVLSWIEWVT